MLDFYDKTMGLVHDTDIDERLRGNLLLNTTLRWTDAEIMASDVVPMKQADHYIDIFWSTPDGEPSETPLSLTGSGKITAENSELYQVLGITNIPNDVYLSLPDAPTTIGEGISLENIHIECSSASKGVTIDGTLKNCYIEPDHGAIVDLTRATISGARHYSNGSLQEWSLPLGVTFRAVHGLADGSILAPELTLAYVADISRNNPSMRCTNGHFNSTIEGYAPNLSSFMMNAGINWIIDQNWSLGASYNLEVTGDQTDQAINGSVRYSF